MDSSDSEIEEKDEKKETVDDGLQYFEVPPVLIDPKSSHLDLTNCRITKLEDIPYFQQCVKLAHLTLRQNHLQHLSSLDFCALTLKYLDLYENKFFQISPELSTLLSLNYLDISFNSIRIISNLDNLTNLVELYLVNNKIREINGLDALVNLRILELGANRIRKIEHLDKLVNLEELWLGRNKIIEIENIQNLNKIKKISLQSNRLTSIGLGLSFSLSLIELSLSENGIKVLNDNGLIIIGLDSLINLQLLDLADNFIENISPIIHLLNLEELWLNNNKIFDWKELEELKVLSQLKTIYLEHNPISQDKYYKMKILRIFPGLIQLDADLTTNITITTS